MRVPDLDCAYFETYKGCSSADKPDNTAVVLRARNAALRKQGHFVVSKGYIKETLESNFGLFTKVRNQAFHQ